MKKILDSYAIKNIYIMNKKVKDVQTQFVDILTHDNPVNVRLFNPECIWSMIPVVFEKCFWDIKEYNSH